MAVSLNSSQIGLTRRESMTVIRAELAAEFRSGDDVVLLAADGSGIAAFASGLEKAIKHGTSQLENNGITHEISMRDGESGVDLNGDRVVWRFDPAKADEVIAYLHALSTNDRPGHQYVDISKPTDTLVISRDEYV